ncbi:MAG TPA: hypothetical protein VF791_09900 [Pyrinomonadaceae bacterium]
MKTTLRKTLAALVLTLTIALSAFAGEMPCPGVIDPPQNATVIEQEITGITDAMSCPGATTLDPVTEFTLSLLQSVLSIF